MTNRDDTSQTTPMSDTNNEDDPRPNHDTDTFETRTTKRLGQLGTDVFEEEHRKTDVDEMVEEVEITAFQVCECGNTLTGPGDIYRCRHCGDLACVECRIRLNRYNYCPECVQTAYGIRRDVFITLYLLDEQVIALNNLVRVEEFGGDVVDVQIDDIAATLLDNELVRTGNDDDQTAAVSDDDQLSADGKQALHIGEQLYGQDPDILDLKEQVAIRQAAERGH